MRLVGQYVEEHGAVGVVVAEGGRCLLPAPGTSARTRHGATVPSRPVFGADRAPVASEPVATTEVPTSGVPAARRSFGAGALVITFLVAQVLSTIAYMVVQGIGTWDFAVPAGVGAAVGQAASQTATGQTLDISLPPPLWITALLQLPLWATLALLPLWFATRRGRGVVAELGLRMRPIDVPFGLVIGVMSQLLLVPALYWVVFKVIGEKDISAAARQLTDRATDPVSVALVFLIVGIGAPIAEEIYYRGMAQRIFGRRLRPWLAVSAAAVFFAASHLQPLQFPALLVFGVLLGVLAWKFDRLGPSIWAHVGFNVTAAVGLLFGLGFG